MQIRKLFQEFEDWDDVGLNMPRPASLASLFWGNAGGLNIPKADASTEMDIKSCEVACQTDVDENVCVSCQTSVDNETDWNHEVISV